MANDELVAMLKQGVAAWNAWRDENRNIRPNLSEVNLSKADLSKADLRDADLREANLGQAILFKANLIGANLSGAYLFGASSEFDRRQDCPPALNKSYAIHHTVLNLERAWHTKPVRHVDVADQGRAVRVAGHRRIALLH